MRITKRMLRERSVKTGTAIWSLSDGMVNASVACFAVTRVCFCKADSAESLLGSERSGPEAFQALT